MNERSNMHMAHLRICPLEKEALRVSAKAMVAGLLLASGTVVFGQSAPYHIEHAEKKAVIDSLARLLNGYYIFPEKCAPAIERIHGQFNKGVYADISDARAFADALNEDIVGVLDDRHFRILFDPGHASAEGAEPDTAAATPTDADRRSNFGVSDVRILSGNVGYLDLTGFYDLKYASTAINAAMGLLRNTDAIIMDLRRNHGGASDLGPYLSGFFFREPMLLYDLHTRDGSKTVHQQYWSASYVEGGPMPDVPIYLLTSGFTFSAAEALAYSLRSLGRATIVGGITGGGAHMWTGLSVNDRFQVHMPHARPLDPRTGTNWETTGVLPDITCQAGSALLAAHIHALNQLRTNDPANAAMYAWHLEPLVARSGQVTAPMQASSNFAGNYGRIGITHRQGRLFMEWMGATCELLPIDAHYFMTREFDFFRIRFIERKGKVEAIRVVNEDGSEREFQRAGK